MRLGLTVLSGTLAVALIGGPVGGALDRADARLAAPVDTPAPRVLAISVDGLNVAAIRRLGTERAPTLHQLVREGASTLNARTAFEQNVTLPNHTGMLTSRRIEAATGGHGVTWNDDRPTTTVHEAAGHQVDSVYSVVQDADRGTALFSTKEKFGIFERSWPVGRFVVDDHQQRLVRKARRDLLKRQRAFTFLHVSLPDRFGHRHGGMTQRYLNAVQRTDRQLGTVIEAIAGDAVLSSSVTVILTSDHGFIAGRKDHSAKRPANYRVAFTVWGAGVRAGDLYARNRDYRDPGRTRPAYARKRQPVRNADLGNLALDLLGLDAIPGSEFDRRQSLDVD